MIYNDKKAFSLVEVLQTVVLLGFIAGLSISFFRKLNPDDKIYASTAKMLQEAVQEINRQVCDDVTPDCSELAANAVAGCPTAGGHTAIDVVGTPYNGETGYCEYARADDGDGNLVCPFGSFNAGLANPICQEIPHCYDAAGDDYFTGVAPNNTDDFKSSMLGTTICPNGVPNLAITRIPDGAAVNMTEFCIRMHELINHRPQKSSSDLAVTPATDWTATCGSQNTDPFIGAANDNCLANIQSANCLGRTTDTTQANYRSNNANMILPNGARLYFNPNVAPFIVFVKYDRIPTLDANAVPGRNLGAFRIDADGTFTELIPTATGFQLPAPAAAP